MFSQHMNLNELRVFSNVYDKLSMTKAAQAMHLTQSGISQHISSLETNLGVKLFDRLNKKLYPTPAGRALYETCKRSFENLEGTLQEIKGGSESLIGTLHIAMPQQFGANIIAPLLGEFSQLHPLVRFNLKFSYSQNIVSDLQKGELDIGFIDEFYTNSLVEHKAVYTETLELVILKKLLNNYPKYRHHKKYYESLPYVDYEADKPLALGWFQHHLGTERMKLNYKAFVPSTGGVATLIASGMGAGIIPAHVTKLLTDSDLHVFQSRSKVPLRNTIHLAYLKGRTLSPAVEALITWLEEKLNA